MTHFGVNFSRIKGDRRRVLGWIFLPPLAILIIILFLVPK